mmetsp:Transcript_49914/g.99354  ORF Transcript_49914/g.99354 Transcript_49914/m.99354 type:complete len:192 (-) Transcript_49914:147-722(-)
MCSGMGGAEQACKNVGLKNDIPVRHVFASDKEPKCQKSKTLAKNHDIEAMDKDITVRDPVTVPDHDLLVAGFPCQGFSGLGEQEGFDDERSTTFFNIVEVIEAKQSKFVLLENDAALLTNNNGKDWEVVKSHLNSLTGYVWTHKTLHPYDYDVPQSRDRVYIIGIKGSCPFEFPPPLQPVKYPLRHSEWRA